MNTTTSPGDGVIYTETIVHAPPEQFAADAPYQLVVVALEAQGRDIIHLEIGEPDFNTPRHIVDAGKAALEEGWTHYGPTQGLPELRTSIARYISRTREIEVGPEHVC